LVGGFIAGIVKRFVQSHVLTTQQPPSLRLADKSVVSSSHCSGAYKKLLAYSIIWL
jgi:hypothetical protein